MANIKDVNGTFTRDQLLELKSRRIAWTGAPDHEYEEAVSDLCRLALRDLDDTPGGVSVEIRNGEVKYTNTEPTFRTRDEVVAALRSGRRVTVADARAVGMPIGWPGPRHQAYPVVYVDGERRRLDDDSIRCRHCAADLTVSHRRLVGLYGEPGPAPYCDDDCAEAAHQPSRRGGSTTHGA